MSVILMTTVFYKTWLLQGEIWCWSLLGFKGLNEKKKDPEQPFLSLRRWLSKWTNSEVILSHTKNQLHVFQQLLLNFTLDGNITVHKTTNIRFLPSQVADW